MPPESVPISDGWLVLRAPRLSASVRMDRRVPLVAGLLLLATLAVMVINIGVGEYPIAPMDVLRTVLRLPSANPEYAFVVNTLRLPRMLVAALVGVALGLSGLILQSLTRNALAAPDILGVNAGAGAVVVTLVVMGGGVSAQLLSWAAFGGGAAAAALIYLLAWRGESAPLRLVLVGIGLAAVLNALITLLITFGEINTVQRAMIWLTGSVYGSTWESLRALLPWVAVGWPLAFWLARDLNALNLGEQVARGLGANVERQRGLLLLLSVALAGAGVAAAGSIGFVALMAPHAARRLVGADHTGLVPVVGLLGALLVTAADLVGRTLFAPTELPCGLITAAIGAPFFLILLRRRHGG